MKLIALTFLFANLFFQTQLAFSAPSPKKLVTVCSYSFGVIDFQSCEASYFCPEEAVVLTFDGSKPINNFPQKSGLVCILPVGLDDGDDDLNESLVF